MLLLWHCARIDDVKLIERVIVKSQVWQKYSQTQHIQRVAGGTDQTSGECSLGQTIPI